MIDIKDLKRVTYYKNCYIYKRHNSSIRVVKNLKSKVITIQGRLVIEDKDITTYINQGSDVITRVGINVAITGISLSIEAATLLN